MGGTGARLSLRNPTSSRHSSTFALAGVMTGLFTIVGCGAPPPSDLFSQAPEPTIERGRDLFKSHGCVNCHGPEGHGDGHLAPTLEPPPRDFRDRAAYIQGTTAEAIAETLSTGIVKRRTGMPPYAHLPRNDRVSIGLFIASLQSQPQHADEP